MIGIKLTQSSRVMRVTQKIVTFRPLPQSGISLMGDWIVNFNWENLYNATTAHEKAEILQNTLLEKLN